MKLLLKYLTLLVQTNNKQEPYLQKLPAYKQKLYLFFLCSIKSSVSDYVFCNIFLYSNDLLGTIRVKDSLRQYILELFIINY